MTVSSEPHVALDAVGTLLQGQLVGGQGVLGRSADAPRWATTNGCAATTSSAVDMTSMLPVPGPGTQPSGLIHSAALGPFPWALFLGARCPAAWPAGDSRPGSPSRPYVRPRPPSGAGALDLLAHETVKHPPQQQ